MPSGLQVWDASGNLTVDITTRMGRVLGVVTIASGVDGSATNAALDDGTPFWICTPRAGAQDKIPDISVSGTTISWDFQAGYTYAATDYRLVYGVY